MFRMVLLIALAFPFFVFAQEPIPSLTYSDPETDETYKPVTREGLLVEITDIKRKLSPFFKKDEKERASLNALLALARSDNMRVPSDYTEEKIARLEEQIADLEVRKPIERVLLENTLEHRRYALTRLDDRQFFKLKDIPSLLKENNRLFISLDNAIKSLGYGLTYFARDFSVESTEEETEKIVSKMHEIHVYMDQLEEWRDSIVKQRAYLLSDRNRYRHALEIAAIKKAIQATSAPLKFLNNILSSRRDALFAELKNELNKLDIHSEDEDFDIRGNAQNALKNPLYDRKKKDVIRNLLKQEQQLQDSPIHLLFWEANEKISQLYGKLLKVDPDSTFDTRPYLLKILSVPSSVRFYGPTPSA